MAAKVEKKLSHDPLSHEERQAVQRMLDAVFKDRTLAAALGIHVSHLENTETQRIVTIEHGPVVIVGRRQHFMAIDSIVVHVGDSDEQTDNLMYQEPKPEPWWAYIRKHVVPLADKALDVQRKREEAQQAASEKTLAAARVALGKVI